MLQLLLTIGILNAFCGGGIGPVPFRVILSASLQTRSCAIQIQESIEVLAPSMVVGNGGKIEAYTTAEMETLFRQAPYAQMTRLDKVWKKYLNANHSVHPIAPQVFTHIKKMEIATGGDLIFCLLSEGCRPKIGDAGHYPMRDPIFQMEAFHAQIQEASHTVMLDGQPKISPTIMALFPNIILLSSTTVEDSFRSGYAADRIEEIVHEVTHDHDYDFIEQWIRACLWLMTNGHITDELFSDTRYIRLADLHGRYQVTIDTGFLILFLESRAYDMTNHASHVLRGLTTLGKQNLDALGRNFAFQQVEQLKEVSQVILTQGTTGFKGPIEEKNIFEFGVQTGQLMNNTIQRYRGLSSPKQ